MQYENIKKNTIKKKYIYMFKLNKTLFNSSLPFPFLSLVQQQFSPQIKIAVNFDKIGHK